MCTKKVKEFEANPVKALAEAAVWANPGLELVSSDDEAETMTILDKESGKKTTVNFEDAAEGRFSIETEDGTKATFGGKAGEMTAEGPEGVREWKSLMHQEQGTKVNGMVHGKTAHKVEDVFAVFEANLKTAGFERTSKTETAEAWIGSFRNEEKTRTIALTINWKNAAKVVGISYSSR